MAWCNNNHLSSLISSVSQEPSQGRKVKSWLFHDVLVLCCRTQRLRAEGRLIHSQVWWLGLAVSWNPPPSWPLHVAWTSSQHGNWVPGARNPKESQTELIAFYDLVLEFVQCHFCLIPLAEAVPKVHPLLNAGMSMSHYKKNTWDGHVLV